MKPAYFVSPRKGFLGWLQNSLANMQLLKQLRRMMSARLPFPTLESDVSDIVYANWIVPLAAVKHLIPPGVNVIDVDGKTILTILTYAHGHFGPSAAGPFRRLFPSPLQSNWRLYVQSVAGKKPAKPTVLFLANIFDSDLYAIGTRIFSDVMHAHRAMDFNHQRRGKSWITQVNGQGSTPSWKMQSEEVGQFSLPAAFEPFFAGYADALQSLCLQEVAIASVPVIDKIALSEIDLPIDISSVVPLTVSEFIPGHLLSELGATSDPFCFRVPKVKFKVLSETLI